MFDICLSSISYFAKYFIYLNNWPNQIPLIVVRSVVFNQAKYLAKKFPEIPYILEYNAHL